MTHDEINEMLEHAFDPIPVKPKPVVEPEEPKRQEYPIEPRDVWRDWEPFGDELEGLFSHDVIVDVMRFLAAYSIQDLQGMHDGASTSVFFKGLIKCFTELHKGPSVTPLFTPEESARITREIQEEQAKYPAPDVNKPLGQMPTAKLVITEAEAEVMIGQLGELAAWHDLELDLAPRLRAAFPGLTEKYPWFNR